MFGVVVEVAIDPGRGEASEKMLQEAIVPMVKAMPGFVSAYWFQSDDGRTGTSFTLFDTEEHARAVVAVPQGPPEGSGVTLKRAEAMRITAQA